MIGGGSVALDLEGGCWKPNVWQQDSASYHTSSRTQFWVSENFSDYITTSDALTPQIAISLIILCESQFNKRPIKPCATPKMKRRQG